jgi:preprotein translocase subunit SecA
MAWGTLTKLTGDFLSGKGRALKRLEARVARIRSHALSLRSHDDAALRMSLQTLRERHLAGASLDQLMEEAFAAVQDAIHRALGLETRDVQLMGAIALQDGAITEMATGEGKTIVALYPAFLQSLTGKGVHIATLNPYLAQRDHAQAQAVLGLLGCTTGLAEHGMKPATRRRAYAADVTYAAYSEFAKDYLRDHLQMTQADCVQRGHASIILDEIDAILIDEARGLVSLTEPHEPSEKTYRGVEQIMAVLPDDRTAMDPDTSAVYLTETGQDEVEAALRQAGLIRQASSLYDQSNTDITHHVQKALQARYLYQRDRDYVVKGGSIIPIDPVTGRAMPGGRLGDGLHQALEAKENLPLGPETQVLASISVQNYFRIYGRRAGMTATAQDNAREFFDVYDLEVVALPPFAPLRRIDLPDEVFPSREAKLDAVTNRILGAQRKGQPVLVGTSSIRQAEAISQRLASAGLAHAMLTARHDADEAEVIARAGMPAAVTIAANMAGRGTDIQLGGPPPVQGAPAEALADFQSRRQAVLEAGGLLLIGMDRHDSQRMDRQLRGRAGRQGDPGTTVFLLSLEDEILAPVIRNRPELLKSCDTSSRSGQRWAQVFLSRYQKNVESRHSQARVTLMRFDNVVHKQRQVIFAERLRVMENPDLTAVTSAMREQVVTDLVQRHLRHEAMHEEEDLSALKADCGEVLGFAVADLAEIDRLAAARATSRDDIEAYVKSRAAGLAAQRQAEFGPDLSRSLEMQTILNAIDMRWNEHLKLVERLRSVVGFRAYGRRDPLVEYQTEAFELFETMLEKLRFDTTRRLAMARPLDQRQQMQAMESMLFNPGA